MKGQPAFFERVRKNASDEWDLLEQKPRLAGPWHQLFKQVQSPRHVLSELLQNADDVGATDAWVRIENDKFVFEHNGDDFTEEHFDSLCSFGFSNKRDMHTIGFRGIGFKSTFSIGNTVELYTPTLSVKFNNKRFTEPVWIDKSSTADGKTLIRVAISDRHRQQEIEKNFKEWLQNPISLLFFKHIRRLKIGEEKLFWQTQGQGPVERTEIMSLKSDPGKAYILAHSEPEPFPAEALEEIKEERLIVIHQEIDFPPCRIGIVLGTKGRLYVVLPTGVETELPFACNAPFIQDPARIKIKDPEISPTNRWLLERTGSLGASVMLKWLNSSDTVENKSRAYDLLTDVDRENNSLEGVCAAKVEVSFDSVIENEKFLLTETDELKKSGQSVIIPDEIFYVWPTENISEIFDELKRPSVSHHISNSNKNKLVK
ncbi:MAG: ATP-binding protein [Syntrophaceae bacterium]|nr:ATP-binding protein [Syntrophaceae bacterium]